jgi:hypothetical protein
LLLSLIKLVILQVILLILEKRYSFHNRYSKIHKNHFHVSLWEQRKYLEDVTQDSVKKEKKLSVPHCCYGHPFRYYLNSYLYFLDSFIQNPFHLILTKLFRKEHHSKLQEILSQIKGSVQRHFRTDHRNDFVSILTSIGLYIIGVPYFMLLGIITGILNLIPMSEF